MYELRKDKANLTRTPEASPALLSLCGTWCLHPGKDTKNMSASRKIIINLKAMPSTIIPSHIIPRNNLNKS